MASWEALRRVCTSRVEEHERIQTSPKEPRFEEEEDRSLGLPSGIPSGILTSSQPWRVEHMALTVRDEEKALSTQN